MVDQIHHLLISESRGNGVKNIDWRRFLMIWLFAGAASFITLLVVQYFQGEVDAVVKVLGKGAAVGLSIAVMFSLPRKRKDYPWM